MKKSPLTSKVEEELDILARTVDILVAVEEEQPIGISKLSTILDIPEHKVRYSLRMLQKEGIIQPTAAGAVISSEHREFKMHLKELLKELKETMKRLQGVVDI